MSSPNAPTLLAERSLEVVYKPWRLADTVFGPVPVCLRCDGPLTREFDSDEPAQDECPDCGAILRFKPREG